MKYISKYLLNLEKNHKLLEWKIDNVYAWQSARSKIYLNIIDSIIPNNVYKKKNNILNLYNNIYKRILINCILYNPFIDRKKSDVLVFESGRRYYIEGEYIDIYTKYVCDELEKECITFTKYDTNYLLDNLVKRKKRNKHIDIILILSKILSIFIKVKINKYDLKKIILIENEIGSSLKISIDINNIIKKEIKRFKSQYYFYMILLKIKKSKMVYLVNSCDKAPLIKAAKDNNAIVNELQHGLIVKEGFIGNYPYTKVDSLEYFPNRFYVWKNSNMYTSKLPLSEINIIEMENQHLKNMMKINKSIVRKNNQILVVSQPYASDEIIRFIIKNVEEMKNWKIIYKIHPVEDSSKYKNNKEYQFNKHCNISFVENDVSIYRLYSESEYIIGIYSTALFEAVYFGCKPIILNLPGVEMADSIIKNGKGILVNVNEKITQVLAKN